MFQVSRTLLKALLLLAINTANAAQLDTGNIDSRIQTDLVLKRYVEAIGGRSAIERLTNRTFTGTETTDLTSRTQPLLEVHWFKACGDKSGRYAMEIVTDQGSQRWGNDGVVNWAADKCGVHFESSSTNRLLAFLLNPQGALQVEEYFPDLRFLGKRVAGGRKCYAFLPAGHDEAYYSLHFDIESGLLVQIGYFKQLKDYRSVDGVLFPHMVSSSRKGGSTTYRFEDVLHNGEIDEDLFNVPEGP